MTEPISFSEQLRAWRQRKEALGAVRPPTGTSDNLLPFRRHAATCLEDPPKGDVPWLDWLRAEPWVPVIED
jgi:hypothetical protein